MVGYALSYATACEPAPPRREKNFGSAPGYPPGGRCDSACACLERVRDIAHQERAYAGGPIPYRTFRSERGSPRSQYTEGLPLITEEASSVETVHPSQPWLHRIRPPLPTVRARARYASATRLRRGAHASQARAGGDTADLLCVWLRDVADTGESVGSSSRPRSRSRIAARRELPSVQREGEGAVRGGLPTLLLRTPLNPRAPRKRASTFSPFLETTVRQ